MLPQEWLEFLRSPPPHQDTSPRSCDCPHDWNTHHTKIHSLGTLWQEPDEYIEIFNIGTQPVQLAGWSIRDAEGHAFIFPKFILGAGQYCRVLTDDYQPDHCGFSFYRPSPVWDNDGDCGYLQDSQGKSDRRILLLKRQHQ